METTNQLEKANFRALIEADEDGRTQETLNIIDVFLDTEEHVTLDEICHLLKERGHNYDPQFVKQCMNRMVDFGFHLWSSHHPWVVPQPFTIEPTESYSKAELDEYLAGLEKTVNEAYEDPDKVKNAPYQSVSHKIDHHPLDDPEKWAITWRAYLKKQKKGE